MVVLTFVSGYGHYTSLSRMLELPVVASGPGQHPAIILNETNGLGDFRQILTPCERLISVQNLAQAESLAHQAGDGRVVLVDVAGEGAHQEDGYAFSLG